MFNCLIKANWEKIKAKLDGEAKTKESQSPISECTKGEFGTCWGQENAALTLPS